MTDFVLSQRNIDLFGQIFTPLLNEARAQVIPHVVPNGEGVGDCFLLADHELWQLSANAPPSVEPFARFLVTINLWQELLASGDVEHATIAAFAAGIAAVESRSLEATKKTLRQLLLDAPIRSRGSANGGRGSGRWDYEIDHAARVVQQEILAKNPRSTKEAIYSAVYAEVEDRFKEEFCRSQIQKRLAGPPLEPPSAG